MRASALSSIVQGAGLLLRRLSSHPSLHQLFLPCCLLVLAACATDAPPATFDLDPSVSFDHIKSSRGQLAIYTPTSTLPLESRRIVVRTGAGTIAYLHGAQWSENLPDLVQERLIGGFEQANVLRAVGRPGLVANGSLHTDIQHFEVDIARKQATVEIYARLVSADGRVIADRTFSATAPAADDHVTTVTASIGQAFVQVIHELVIWTAPRI